MAFCFSNINVYINSFIVKYLKLFIFKIELQKIDFENKDKCGKL